MDLDLGQGRGDMDVFLLQSQFHLSDFAVAFWLSRNWRRSEESRVSLDVANCFDDCFEVALPHSAVTDVFRRQRGGCGGRWHNNNAVKAQGGVRSTGRDGG